MVTRERVLKAREFVFFCEELALASLPPELPRPERKVMWTILQLHYGNPAVHFELQPHVGRGVVELGLHMEGPVEWNDAWAALLSGQADELASALGDEWELEEWTASWRRLHRTFRFEKLTSTLAEEVAGELARALTTLHPLVANSALSAVLPPESKAPARTGKPREWGKRRAK